MTEYIEKKKLVNRLKMWLMDLENDMDKGDYGELCENKGAREAVESCICEVEEQPLADVQPIRHGRWINAQTNPPIATDGETSDYVLVLRASGRQCVCYYVYDDDDGNYWFSEDEKSMYDIDEVTHWQPLPEPPKE